MGSTTLCLSEVEGCALGSVRFINCTSDSGTVTETPCVSHLQCEGGPVRDAEALHHLDVQTDGRGDQKLSFQKQAGTNLIVQVFLGFQREVLVILPGQHVGPHADGEVAGVHLADLGVLADQVEHGEQVLEQQQVGPRQLLCDPAKRFRGRLRGASGFAGCSVAAETPSPRLPLK